MMKNRTLGFIIVLLMLISGFSCEGGGNSGEDNAYQYYNYQIPENTGDGWLTGSLETVGMSVEPLKDLMEILLNRESHEIHSILVIKDDLLVFEEYFAGHDFDLNAWNYHGKWINFNRDTRHNLHSVTKHGAQHRCVPTWSPRGRCARPCALLRSASRLLLRPL